MSIENQNVEEKNRVGGKTAFKNALCYVPFVAPVLFFIEQEKTPELSKHIKYGSFLLFGLILSKFISDILPFGGIYGIFVLVYLIASSILAYKAYS